MVGSTLPQSFLLLTENFGRDSWCPGESKRVWGNGHCLPSWQELLGGWCSDMIYASKESPGVMRHRVFIFQQFMSNAITALEWWAKSIIHGSQYIRPCSPNSHKRKNMLPDSGSRSLPLWNSPKVQSLPSLTGISSQWKEKLGIWGAAYGTTHGLARILQKSRQAKNLQRFFCCWYSQYDFHIGGWYSSASRMKREITSDCMSTCQSVSSLEEGQPVRWTQFQPLGSLCSWAEQFQPQRRNMSGNLWAQQQHHLWIITVTE